MLSYKLLLACLVASGLYLLIISYILHVIEKKMKLAGNLDQELVEEMTVGWFFTNFIMEFLFYVVIPAIAFSFFYLIIPLPAHKTGLAVTLVAFILGAAPVLMGLSVRIKLPMPYILFILMSLLIKLGGSMFLIGYLYSL